MCPINAREADTNSIVPVSPPPLPKCTAQGGSQGVRYMLCVPDTSLESAALNHFLKVCASGTALTHFDSVLTTRHASAPQYPLYKTDAPPSFACSSTQPFMLRGRSGNVTLTGLTEEQVVQLGQELASNTDVTSLELRGA